MIRDVSAVLSVVPDVVVFVFSSSSCRDHAATERQFLAEQKCCWQGVAVQSCRAPCSNWRWLCQHRRCRVCRLQTAGHVRCRLVKWRNKCHFVICSYSQWNPKCWIFRLRGVQKSYYCLTLRFISDPGENLPLKQNLLLP